MKHVYLLGVLLLVLAAAACSSKPSLEGTTPEATATPEVLIGELPEGGAILFANAFPGATATDRLDAAIAACGGRRCFVIAPAGLGSGPPSSMPDNVTLIDLRQESVRIIRRGHPLASGEPQSFANELNHSTLVAADVVPPDEDHEQDQAIAGLIDNFSPNLNAVGVWGGAQSRARGARVWGGFTLAANAPGQDAQVISLEVDTRNQALPGIVPNASKIGVQIVGLGPDPSQGVPPGDYRNTAAIEILSDRVGQWVNGIVFDDGALAADGTILGVAQPGPLRLGLDFSATTFTDAAIRIKNNQKIRFDVPGANPASVYSDAQPQSALALVAGPGGIRLIDNSGSRTLLVIEPDGTLRVQGPIMEGDSRVNTRANTHMHFGAGTGMAPAPQPGVPFGATVFDSPVRLLRMTVTITAAGSGGTQGTAWRVTDGSQSLTLTTPPGAKAGDILTVQGDVAIGAGSKVWLDVASTDAQQLPGANVSVEYVEQ